ncbi:MAG TPA: pyridoxal-phosphate dependent enzyme [Flavisolibacter sp.]
MTVINTAPVRTDRLSFYQKFHTTVDVLRLDLIHPVISGNKWFKLQKYLADAVTAGKKGIVTFGGAWSNHIVATAAACHLQGLQSVGIIRGERPATPSHTLKQAAAFGMQFHFISREEYKNSPMTAALNLVSDAQHWYIVPEGGYGPKGMEGAATILDLLQTDNLTHIICAAGTGTMAAGLLAGSRPQHQVVAISVLKNNHGLADAITALSGPQERTRLQVQHEYHAGGYAKYDDALLSFMNDWFRHTGIPSDFVYTGKLFRAVDDMIKTGWFPGNSHLLVIHSGGLQGNRSLPKGTLIFEPVE